MTETTRAPVDVFEKARSHDRKEQLDAAREGDVLPYFRLMTSEAGPVVQMEGRETIMLGSNNYLGLTGDPRVKAAARDATPSSSSDAVPRPLGLLWIGSPIGTHAGLLILVGGADEASAGHDRDGWPLPLSRYLGVRIYEGLP